MALPDCSPRRKVHDEPGQQLNSHPAISTLVVFGLVCFILFTKVWPKIATGLDERQAKIRQEIEAAEAGAGGSQGLDGIASMPSWRNARAEANEMISRRPRRTPRQLRPGPPRASAGRSSTEMREQGQPPNPGAAKEAAITELHAESAMLATAIATRILQREINALMTSRTFIDDSLRELESAHGG